MEGVKSENKGVLTVGVKSVVKQELYIKGELHDRQNEQFMEQDMNTVIKDELILEETNKDQHIPESHSLAHLTNIITEEVLPGALIHEQHTTGLDKDEAESPPHVLVQQCKSGEIKKQYQCNVCNKTYTKSDSLSNHKLIHACINKYQC